VALPLQTPMQILATVNAPGDRSTATVPGCESKPTHHRAMTIP